MKAKELIKLLSEYPEFEVETSITIQDKSEWGITVDIYKIMGIGDIGHSEKVISLNIEKESL